MELRSAIEKLKNHYICFLIDSGFKDESEEELKKMTFTELKNLCKNFSK
jgi:hypothetical protein